MRLKAVSGIVLTVLLVGMLVLTFLCARASASWANDTITTTENWWDKLVKDAKWSWNWVLNLTEDYSNYGNLTPVYHHISGVGDQLWNVITGIGLSLYKLTGNSTYLQYAQWAFNDEITYAQNSTTKLIATIYRSNGTHVNTIKDSTVDTFYHAILLSQLNSSYSSYIDELANAIIKYHFEQNSVNPELPVNVHPNGEKYNDDMWVNILMEYVDRFLDAYEFTGNSTYLDVARGIIVRYWDCHASETNLIAGGVNSETSNLTYLSDGVKHYRYGTFLRLTAKYYMIDQNSTILNILNTSAKAGCNHIYDDTNGCWTYLTDVSEGMPSWNILEGNWASMSYGMLMAYEVVGNSTFYSCVKNDFDFELQDEGRNLISGLICHGTKKDGTTPTDEATLAFGFSTVMSVFSYLYRNGDVTSQGIERIYTLYNESIKYHSDNYNREYGYARTLKASNPTVVVTLAGKGNRYSQAPTAILPYTQFYIRPSSGVEIVWDSLPYGNINQMWTCQNYLDAREAGYWFRNVSFDYADRKISFDEITGSGTVTFNETIVSATKDGTSYSNFSGSTLMTVSGKHSYEVYFARPHADPTPVGGIWVPVDEFALLAPYIALASTIIVATAATAIYMSSAERRNNKPFHSLILLSLLTQRGMSKSPSHHHRKESEGF